MKQMEEKHGRQAGSAGVFLFCQTRCAMGKEIFYDYYRCSDLTAARRFLEHSAQPAPFHYMVVLTPEGSIGKDEEGIYVISDSLAHELGQCKQT